MPGVVSVGSTGNQDVNGLLSGIRWAPLSLTFSFPGSASNYGAGYGSGEPNSGFAQLNATQQAAVRTIFQSYSAVSNLTFTEITETDTTHGDLRFARSTVPGTAWAYYPWPDAEGGDTWIRNSSTYNNPTKGNYAYLTFVHEIGHALGLKHGHETDTYGAMTTAHDSMEYSVMTYRGYVGAPTSGGYTNESWGYAQSIMMYDIAALQQMYGANYNTNSGNTTYSWNPTTGEMSINGAGQGAPGGNRIFMTVWDGNGVDTYDFSNYTTGVTVDLTPGNWSTTSTAQLARLDYWAANTHIAAGNIANALLYNNDIRSLIENAIGGSNNDTITGNQANNTLNGGAGSDTLYGLAGSDTLIGGTGTDTLTGGGGNDAFRFMNATGGADTVTDFVSGSDILQLDRAGFGLSSTGSLAAAGVNFVNGMTATSAAPTILFNSANGGVYWDSDGTGGAAAVQFATVNGLGGYNKSATTTPGAGWNSPIVGDFNGDGTEDIFWLNQSTGEAFEWWMKDGAVDTVFNVGIMGPAWRVLATGDFNGDGTTDFMWQNTQTNQGLEWFMTGVYATSWNYFNLLPTNWQLILTDDLNNDGTDDLFWQDLSTGAGVEWFMHNGQVASTRDVGTMGTNWRVISTGDFNGDGNSDLLWQNNSISNGTPNGVLWYLNAQGWATGWSRIALPDQNWQLLSTRDFNLDGTDDVLWQNTSTGQAVEWLFKDGTLSSTADLGSPGPTMKLTASGDFNGDGSIDFLWRNTTTGQAAEWLKSPLSLTPNDWLIV
jgi:serralysin